MSQTSTKRPTSRYEVETALLAIKADGLVELPLEQIERPVAAWLDQLIGLAELDGLELTWTTRDDLLCVIDIEA